MGHRSPDTQSFLQAPEVLGGPEPVPAPPLQNSGCCCCHWPVGVAVLFRCGERDAVGVCADISPSPSSVLASFSGWTPVPGTRLGGSRHARPPLPGPVPGPTGLLSSPGGLDAPVHRDVPLPVYLPQSHGSPAALAASRHLLPGASIRQGLVHFSVQVCQPQTWGPAFSSFPSLTSCPASCHSPPSWLTTQPVHYSRVPPRPSPSAWCCVQSRSFGQEEGRQTPHLSWLLHSLPHGSSGPEDWTLPNPPTPTLVGAMLTLVFSASAVAAVPGAGGCCLPGPEPHPPHGPPGLRVLLQTGRCSADQAAQVLLCHLVGRGGRARVLVSVPPRQA